MTTKLRFGFMGILLLPVGVGVGVVEGREVGSISRNLATINDVNSTKQRYAINFRDSVHDRAIASSAV